MSSNKFKIAVFDLMDEYNMGFLQAQCFEVNNASYDNRCETCGNYKDCLKVKERRKYD